nr:acyloxyacyl hydrolase [Pseudomonas sp. FME51]
MRHCGGILPRRVSRCISTSTRSCSLCVEQKGRLGVPAIHYSNAGIKQPNEGIETMRCFILSVFDPLLVSLCST